MHTTCLNFQLATSYSYSLKKKKNYTFNFLYHDKSNNSTKLVLVPDRSVVHHQINYSCPNICQ